MRLDQLKTKIPFSDYVSTRWYRAPECILKFPKYNQKVDVFAIGCIMAELYGMGPAFCGKNALDQLRIY
jgi:serine/threonine protein kinase